MSDHQTVTGTLTASGATSAVFYLRPDEVVAVTATFTGTGKVSLSQVLGQPAQAYRPLIAWTTSQSATEWRNTTNQDLYLVLRADTLDTGASVAYTLADVAGDQILQEWRAADGTLAFRITDQGPVGGVVGPSLDVRAFGAVGDGVTDDTEAVQAAIDAAYAAQQGPIFFPEGTYRVTASLQLYRLIRLQGAAMDSTIINYTPTTGALFILGSYDGAKDFVSSPPGQQYEISEMTLRGGYNNTTVAGRAFGTPYGIVDYESGHARIIRVRAQGWYTFFWGIASDFNYVEDVMAVLNGTVFAYYNRTDQSIFSGCKGYGNHTYFLFRGVSGQLLLNPQFIENTGPDIDIGGSEAVVADPLGAGNFTGIAAHGGQGVLIENPWFELYNTTGAALEHEVGQPTKAEFVLLGSSPDTSAERPTYGVTVVNPHFHTISDDSPNVAAVQCFIRQLYADRVRVEGSATFEREVKWPFVITENAGSTEWTSGGIARRAFTSSPDLRDLTFCREDRRLLWAPPVLQTPAPSQDASALPVVATEVLLNPRLARNAATTTPVGWTLRANTTATAYSLAVGETSRSGYPLTLEAVANLAGMQQEASFIRGGCQYDVTIRYKTSADSGNWQIGINPDPSGGGMPSSAWYQYLQTQSVFSEVTFRVTTYDVATVAAARGVQLLYLGSTSGDQIIVDYISVREVAPMGAREPVVRTLSSDRGNAAVTLTPGVDQHVQRFNTTLTTDRAVTLAAGWRGAWFRITRPAGGAFNLNVGTGPLKALAAGTWCDVEHDGSAWVLTAYGSL